MATSSVFISIVLFRIVFVVDLTSLVEVLEVAVVTGIVVLVLVRFLFLVEGVV
jgi:hypothetical protein